MEDGRYYFQYVSCLRLAHECNWGQLGCQAESV